MALAIAQVVLSKCDKIVSVHYYCSYLNMRQLQALWLTGPRDADRGRVPEKGEPGLWDLDTKV